MPFVPKGAEWGLRGADFFWGVRPPIFSVLPKTRWRTHRTGHVWIVGPIRALSLSPTCRETDAREKRRVQRERERGVGVGGGGGGAPVSSGEWAVIRITMLVHAVDIAGVAVSDKLVRGTVCGLSLSSSARETETRQKRERAKRERERKGGLKGGPKRD